MTKKKLVYYFSFTVFFFLFINLFYNHIWAYFGYGFPRSTFFHIPGEAFSDFFKAIINFHNLGSNFTVRDGEEINLYFRTFKDYPLITKHVNFSFFSQNNMILPPLYSFLTGLNAIFFKLVSPYLVYFFNIFLFLIIFFFQIKNFLVDNKISFIIFITVIFSYAFLFMWNRGHIFSAFLCLILIQILINCYLKKNFIQNFFLVMLAFSGKLTALCFALYIFNYNISFLKKIIYFFLLLILCPLFFILINEFNYIFLGNIWSFYKNFIGTLRMHSQVLYYNMYIIGDAGLAYGSSLWGPVKFFLRSFHDANLHIWVKITFIFCSLVFLPFFLLFFKKKISTPVFLYSLVSYYILASSVSADYHLIVFFGPLLLLLKDYENSDDKDLYIILILALAFIVSPQHFFLTIENVPEKTILNPLLILITNIYILFKNKFFLLNVNRVSR
jgi:hypothetical protein